MKASPLTDWKDAYILPPSQAQVISQCSVIFYCEVSDAAVCRIQATIKAGSVFTLIRELMTIAPAFTMGL